jgi:ribulose-phosphate 3-epimerase
MDIEIDGGVTPETIRSINDAGANMLVSGSYILNSNSVKESMDKLKIF